MKASFELKRLARSVLGIACALVPFLPSDAMATNHQWNKYHWNKTSAAALVLNVGDCHSANWSAILLDVLSQGYGGAWPEGSTDPDPLIDHWSQAGSPNLSLQPVSCGDKSANIKSYNDDYGDNGWLGLATIWTTLGKNKHITKGETKVNEYYITLAGYSGFDEDIEWHHVLCQELGHTLGVDHVVATTCMNTDTRPLRYPEPNTGDATLLSSSSMYGHYHSGSGGGGSGGGRPGGGPPGGGPVGLTRAVWAERYDTEADLFNAADAVVNATVISSRLDRYVGTGAAVPVTRVVLRVNAILKGTTGPTIVLEQTRGPDLEIVDDPGYVSNDNYILYLRQIGRNTFRTVNADGRIRY